MITPTKGQVKENQQFKLPLFGIHLQWTKAHWGQQKQDDWALLFKSVPYYFELILSQHLCQARAVLDGAAWSSEFGEVITSNQVNHSPSKVMSNSTQIVIVSTSTPGLNFAQDLNIASSAQNNCLKFRGQTHKQVDLHATKAKWCLQDGSFSALTVLARATRKHMD